MHKLLAYPSPYITKIMAILSAKLSGATYDHPTSITQTFAGLNDKAQRTLSGSKRAYKQLCNSSGDSKLSTQIDILDASIRTLKGVFNEEAMACTCTQCLSCEWKKEQATGTKIRSERKDLELRAQQQKTELATLAASMSNLLSQRQVIGDEITPLKRELELQEIDYKTYYTSEIYAQDILQLNEALDKIKIFLGDGTTQYQKEHYTKTAQMVCELRLAMTEEPSEDANVLPEAVVEEYDPEIMAPVTKQLVYLQKVANNYTAFLLGERTLVDVEIIPFVKFHSQHPIPDSFQTIIRQLQAIEELIKSKEVMVLKLKKVQDRIHQTKSALTKKREEDHDLNQQYDDAYAKREVLYAQQAVTTSQRSEILNRQPPHDARLQKLKALQKEQIAALAHKKTQLTQAHQQMVQDRMAAKQTEKLTIWWQDHAQPIQQLLTSRNCRGNTHETVHKLLPKVESELMLIPRELQANLATFLETDDSPRLARIDSVFLPLPDVEWKQPKYIVFNPVIAALFQDGLFFNNPTHDELPDQFKLAENEYYVLVDPPSTWDCHQFGTDYTNDISSPFVIYISDRSIDKTFYTLDDWGGLNLKAVQDREDVQFGGHKMKRLVVQRKRDIPIQERAQQLMRFCDYMMLRLLPVTLVLLLVLLSLVSQFGTDRAPQK